MASFRGARVRRALPRELVARLRAAAARSGVTPYVLLLSAFAAFLQRHTRQEEVVFGAFMNGRKRPDMESVLGCFVNTVVLRIAFADVRSFRGLLARVRDVVTDAQARQELPFYELVKSLRPARDTSKNPLFQVAFTADPPAPRSVSEWSLRPAEVDKGTSRFDLVYAFAECGDDFWLTLEYSADLFDAGTAERLMDRYLTLLGGALDCLEGSASGDPGPPLSALPLLTPEEQKTSKGIYTPREASSPPTGAAVPSTQARTAR